MRRGIVLAALVACAALVLVPSAAVAGSETETFNLVMAAAVPQTGVASNGDVVKVFGGGSFQVNPKEVTAEGTFFHEDSEGNPLGDGSWEATDLLSFQPYGCGIVTFPDPDVILPPNFCGGALKMRVELKAGGVTFDGVLTVFCIVGPKAPSSHNTPPGEGVTLDIPGVINFNHTSGGMNVYIRT